MEKNEKELVLKAWSKFSDEAVQKYISLPGGLRNKNYLLHLPKEEKVVIKIFGLDRYPTEKIKTQCILLEKLFDKNIPVIELIKGKNEKYLQQFECNKSSFDCICSKYVETNIYSEQFLDKELLTNIAISIAQLHEALTGLELNNNIESFTPSPIIERSLNNQTMSVINEYFKTSNVDMFRPGKFIDIYTNTGQKLMEFLRINKSLLKTDQIIHGDYHMANLNIQDRKVKTIFDFDNFTRAPYEYELGVTLVHLDQGDLSTEECISILLNAYVESRKIENIDVEIVLYFMKYRCYYRIFRWFTHSRLLENPGKHYTHYLKKLLYYNQIDYARIRPN